MGDVPCVKMGCRLRGTMAAGGGGALADLSQQRNVESYTGTVRFQAPVVNLSHIVNIDALT